MEKEIGHRQTLQKAVLKEINVRYFFAVGLIATLAVIAFLLNQKHHQIMKEDFKTINISGRQRMLSQRIALLAAMNEKSELKKSINEFTEGLKYLLNTRFVNQEYPEVYSLYHAPDGIKKLSEQLLAADQRQAYNISQSVLNKFDQSTLQMQQISEKEFHQRFILEMIVLAITLALLALEIIFIFIPMARRVKDSFNELNRIEDKSLLASRLSMIGKIASSIGHEIKNPLSVLMVFSKKGMNEVKDEQSNLYFSQIYKGAERINKIIKSLSIQSRETSDDPMEPAPINNIIDDAVEMFSAKMRISDIKLTKNLHFNGTVNCRHAAVSQVIANLLANAIDAVSESQNKEIIIESIKTGEDIVLRISDSGPGVPDNLKDKIFETFITTKEAGKGTGLGLSISKKIMKDHGGDLRLNEAISNSCFELHFQV